MNRNGETVKWAKPITQEQYEQMFGLAPWTIGEYIGVALAFLMLCAVLFTVWSGIEWLLGWKQDEPKEEVQAPDTRDLSEQEKGERRELRKLQRQRRRELSGEG
jgi:hypothetical protein